MASFLCDLCGGVESTMLDEDLDRFIYGRAMYVSHSFMDCFVL
jgi:hypothetical protein